MGLQDEGLSITVEGEEWFRNTDVMFHQNGEEISLSRGNLRLNSTHCCSLGQDKVGTFVRVEQSWSHQDLTFLTSVQTYGDTIIFTQHFPHGLDNVSLGRADTLITM